MRNNPSGIALMNNHGLGKMGNLDFSVSEMGLQREKLAMEGKIPSPNRDFIFEKYLDSGFTINSNGEVKNQNKEIIPYFYNESNPVPRVKIKKTVWKIGEFKPTIIEIEYTVNDIMKKVFKNYIIGFHKIEDMIEDYKLVPKDGNRSNMSLKNLEFQAINPHKEITNRSLLKAFLINNPNIYNHEIPEDFKVPFFTLWDIRKELAKDFGLTKDVRLKALEQYLGFEIKEEDYYLYKTIVECGCILSDRDIAKIIRPENFDQESTKLIRKVSYARKRIKYNTKK